MSVKPDLNLTLAIDFNTRFDDEGERMYQCLGGTYPAFVENMVESDLSGIGVTVSFLLTALGTFIFVLYGFFRNLILERITHRTDKLVISWLPRWKRLPKGLSRERERRDFHTAIQSLGDQQIVIAMAYLVAGVSQPCTMSMYGLKNLVAITWLSAIVHCSTMVVSGRNTTVSGKARTIRLVVTLTMAVLMFSLNFFYLIVSLGWATRINSDAKKAREEWNSISLFFLVQNFWRYLFILRSIQVFVGIVLLFYLSYFYVSMILRVGTVDEESREYGKNRNLRPKPMTETLAQNLFQAKAKRYGISVPSGLRYRIYRQLCDHYDWLELQATVKERIQSASNSRWMWWHVVSGYWVLSSDANLPLEASASLVEEMLWLGFLLSQGLTRFVISWVSLGELSGSEVMNWGVGQVVPVVMLIAPLLTWVSLSSNSEKDSFNLTRQSTELSTCSRVNSTSIHNLVGISTGLSNEKPKVPLSFTSFRLDLISRHQYTPTEFFELPASILLFKIRLFFKFLLAIGICAAQIFEETGDTFYHMLFYVAIFSICVLILMGIFLRDVKRALFRDRRILIRKRRELKRGSTFDSTNPMVRANTLPIPIIHQRQHSGHSTFSQIGQKSRYRSALEQIHESQRAQAESEIGSSTDHLLVLRKQANLKQEELERLEERREDEMVAEMMFLEGMDRPSEWERGGGDGGLPRAQNMKTVGINV